jgi:hypothetical protein
VKKHLIAAGALALTVAGGAAGAVSAQNALPEVEFDVTPNSVKVAPGTQIAAGYTKITLDRLARKGESGLALVKLKAGVTPEELGKAVGKIEDPNDVHKYGRIVASTFIAGKATYSTTIRLEDADYVWVDVTKRPATRLSFHAGPADSGAVEPATDAAVALRDYRFSMPSSLKAGKQTLKVTNDGKVMHHALAFPLAKGVKESALLKKIRDGKEPRKEFAGPPSALVEIVSPKTTNGVEVELRKGKYLFVCFLQDSPRAKMHAQKGMQKIVTVK